MPYSDHITDLESNYYLNWLEEKTGYRLEPVIIRQKDAPAYLDRLFSSDVDTDMVFFGEGFTITVNDVDRYASEGHLVKRENGDFYYPNYGNRAASDCGQVFWINEEWLRRLELKLPETVGELRDVLAAFKNLDPNGNGIHDEIPLIGSADIFYLNPVEFLLNSFIYNDPLHNRKYIDENGRETSAVGQEAFREGLAFCSDMVREGLLDKKSFSTSKSAMSELVNSPADLVGAFTTRSISDVLYQGNPEIMASYIHIPPLSGPEGERNALYTEPVPEVGAVILKKSRHPEEAAILLDTMLTTEASLIARYGEQGVDWDYSEGLDVSIYGTKSTIVTKTYIWDTPQNKHLNGIGAMMVPDDDLKGVTWNGLNSDAEYIDARAGMSYESFFPKESASEEYDPSLAELMNHTITDFVTGKRDIADDREWNDFQKAVEEMRENE